MITDAMIEAGGEAFAATQEPHSDEAPDVAAIYLAMHAARPTADLGEDGELVAWLNEVRTGTHGDITLHSGMAAIRLGKARDRLILYREALGEARADIDFACTAIMKCHEHRGRARLEQRLKRISAILSRSGG